MEVILARFNAILKELEELENIRSEEGEVRFAFAKIKILKSQAKQLLGQIGNHLGTLKSFDDKDGVETIMPSVTLLENLEKINSDNFTREIPKILKKYQDKANHTAVGAINDYVEVEPRGALGRVYR